MTDDTRAAPLRRTLAWQVGLLVAGPLALSAWAVVSLVGSSGDYGSAAAGYRELTRAFELGARVRTARVLLGSIPSDPVAAARAADSAARELAFTPPDAANPALAKARAALDALAERARGGTPAATEWGRATGALDEVLRELAGRARRIEAEVKEAEARARAQQDRTVLLLALSGGVLAALATFVGVAQHRTVTRPVERLTAGVRSLSGRRFDQRVTASGPAELRELAAEFNRMAGELEAVYRDLEARVAERTAEVAEKDRELARAARLASVGYLATAVAHEINNPLSIITGFAERALRTQGTLDEKTRAALTVVTEEAFRCKEITARLLSLAREESLPARPAEAVPLGPLVRQVVETAGALPQAQGRVIEVVEGAPGIAAFARPHDLHQVTLNLLINALDAVGPGTGRVVLTVSRDDRHARLEVRDNGAGMDPDTLARAFAPYFTSKPPTRLTGLGLGLAIVHNLVTAQGGTITAHSDGAGRGSTFTLTWPLAPTPEGGTA